jgi:flagellar biosynthesis component FlhA
MKFSSGVKSMDLKLIISLLSDSSIKDTTNSLTNNSTGVLLPILSLTKCLNLIFPIRMLSIRSMTFFLAYTTKSLSKHKERKEKKEKKGNQQNQQKEIWKERKMRVKMNLKKKSFQEASQSLIDFLLLSEQLKLSARLYLRIHSS